MNIQKEGYTPKNAGKLAPKKPENFTPAGETNIGSNEGAIVTLSSAKSDRRTVILEFYPESKMFMIWLYDYESGSNCMQYARNLRNALEVFDDWASGV